MRQAPRLRDRGGVGQRSPTYEDKLIAALRGPLPDRRVLAAAAAAHALASIDAELACASELTRGGPALVRRAIRSVIGGRGRGGAVPEERAHPDQERVPIAR